MIENPALADDISNELVGHGDRLEPETRNEIEAARARVCPADAERLELRARTFERGGQIAEHPASGSSMCTPR